MTEFPALELHCHPDARAQLCEQGLRPEAFSLFVGASGGPKWLVLSQLDRLIMPWLVQTGLQRTLCSLGSSIGAWRVICLASKDPAEAIARLESGYIEQSYDAQRPTPDAVSSTSDQILRGVLDADNVTHILDHSTVQTHIITARGSGWWQAQDRFRLIGASTLAALSNLYSRAAIAGHLERRVFCSSAQSMLRIDDPLETNWHRLTHANLLDATRASGSIPMVMRGVESLIEGEVHWDGGMTDYHFNPGFKAGNGLTLYPHFYPHTCPGWFDKALYWRRLYAERWPGLVLLCPSAAFVSALPGGRIPTRTDFSTMDSTSRKRAWWSVVEAGKRLAAEFTDLLDHQVLLRRLKAD